MTRVAILPVPTDKGETSYRAIAEGRQSHGSTAGQALDALTKQLSEEETSTLVIVQSLRPDSFFNAAQQKRLAELMDLWRAARDKGESLPPGQQAELEALTEQELSAATNRAAALADELRR